MQRRSSLGIALASLACAAALPAHAGFWSSVIDTTPAGLARNSDDRPGDWASFWSDTKEGAAKIMSSGNSVWILPTYTNHPQWDWPQRSEENGWPMGMGLARGIIDEKGNERMLYLITFVDSNYRPEPMVGYTWVARWPLGNSGLHVGAGYLAGLTMRGDYMWIPAPLPLPLVKVGSDTVSFYGTWIPITNVFFFFSTITLDDAKGRKMPLSPESPWAKTPNLLYGSWGWQYTDNGEKYSQSLIGSDTVWNAGLRRYSGRSWQTDLKYSHSEHEVSRTDGKGKSDLTIESYTLTIAYNMDWAKTFRLFAGAGFGYSKGKTDYASDWSLHPALTLGFTWAAAENFFITGSMDTNFARFKGVLEDRGDGYTVRAMPTSFTLGAGLAF